MISALPIDVGASRMGSQSSGNKESFYASFKPGMTQSNSKPKEEPLLMKNLVRSPLESWADHMQVQT
jgi:hypothetical protein